MTLNGPMGVNTRYFGTIWVKSIEARLLDPYCQREEV